MSEEKLVTRRDFLGTSATSVLAATAYPFIKPLSAVASASAARRRRLAIVGTGVRGIEMWGKDVVEPYKDYVEMVGLCDINPKRVEVAKKAIGVNVPTFTDFDKMVKKTKPDAIIVTTVDCFHSNYIIRGMELGCDIITEKPMTTDEKKCQAVLDAEKKTGKKITVTFNYRYSPHRQKIKEILMSGEIGEVVSVDFHWYLDIYHGADYFRRWHRLKEKSGTLLVHKASHHFDLVNWWLEAEPVEVFAYGKLQHYGHNGPFRSVRCMTCPYKDQCQFYWDITQNKFYMELYVGCESEDGYHRDGCVFRNDIDIYDTMAVQVKYSNGVHMSYSLNAFMPYEGYHIAFNGMKGRVQARIYERQPWEVFPQDEIEVTKNFGKREVIVVPYAEGGHGGGDARLKDMIFKKDVPDPYKLAAGSRDGAMSILTGVAAVKSIETKTPIKIADLVTFSS